MQFGPLSHLLERIKMLTSITRPPQTSCTFLRIYSFPSFINNFIMPAYGSATFGAFIPREFSTIAAAEVLRFDAASDKVSKFSTIVKTAVTKFVGSGDAGSVLIRLTSDGETPEAAD